LDHLPWNLWIPDREDVTRVRTAHEEPLPANSPAELTWLKSPESTKSGESRGLRIKLESRGHPAARSR
jgi:hypothetical protein